MEIGLVTGSGGPGEGGYAAVLGTPGPSPAVAPEALDGEGCEGDHGEDGHAHLGPVVVPGVIPVISGRRPRVGRGLVR
nr:hypothetical protein [Serinicoccus profundi]